MFKGLGDLANLGNIMKQAQEMNTKMQAVGEQLKTKRTTGQAGGGLVEVEVDGTGTVLAVRLDETLVKNGDREMLEDLLPAAFNSAKEKAQVMHQELMQEIAGGMNLPGLGDMMEKFGGGPPSQS